MELATSMELEIHLHFLPLSFSLDRSTNVRHVHYIMTAVWHVTGAAKSQAVRHRWAIPLWDSHI